MSMEDFTNNFRVNIEKERIRQGYSQNAWSKRLGMSLSAYKRLLSDTKSLDFETICQLHYATGMMIFEFFEASSPRLDLIKKLRSLSDEQIKLLTEVIDFIIEKEERNVVKKS